MRTFLVVAAVVGVLAGAAPAQAQWANRSLGVSAGYLHLPASSGFARALPLVVEGTRYLDSGLELYARVPLSLVQERSSRRDVLATGGSAGVRYLFTQERIRPYVGLDLGALVVLGSDTRTYVGPGATLGLDVFVTGSVSVGARALGAALYGVNTPGMLSLGVTGGVAVAFD